MKIRVVYTGEMVLDILTPKGLNQEDKFEYLSNKAKEIIKDINPKLKSDWIEELED